jgi:hypothetical protein
MEILFLLVGLLFIALGLLMLVSELRTWRGAREVPGQVIGFSTGRSGDSGAPSFYSVAEYVGPDGHNRYVQGSVGSSSPLHSVGDAVTVLLQPDDPNKATIKSSLSYVLGGVVALMGLTSCIVFFAVFRLTTFSLAGAVAVVSLGAWKLRGSLRDKPMSLQAWRDYKSRLFGPRTFTDETKGTIPWADPAALRNAVRNQRTANRFAMPLLLLAGVGLILLGAHLHKQTESFLARAVRGPGVVVDLDAGDSTDGSTTYAPVVEFESEDRRHRFKDSIASNPPMYRIGESVGVLYDPYRPSDARIDRGRWNKAIPILVGGFGALFCLLGVCIAIRRRREPHGARTA